MVPPAVVAEIHDCNCDHWCSLHDDMSGVKRASAALSQGPASAQQRGPLMTRTEATFRQRSILGNITLTSPCYV